MRLQKKYSLFMLLSNWHITYPTIITSGFANSIIGPATITQPGTYQLSFDIAGPIIIDADNVTINLNNRTISGGINCISATNHQNISIHNGTVQSASTQAISFDGCRNIEINGIDFLSNAIGLFVTSCTGITLAANVFSENTGSALVIEHSSNANISDGKFFENSAPQIVLLDNVTSVFTKKLNFTGNSANELKVITINNAKNLVFKQINMSQNNPTDFTGWNITNAQNVVLHKCDCSNNAVNDLTGILLDSCQNVLCEKITINNNVTNPLSIVAIFIRFSSDIVIKNSTINDNSSASNCLGINFIASEKIIANTVSISNNSAFNNFDGIAGADITDSCFSHCLIKANSASNVASGIAFSASVMRCFVLNNIIKDNGDFGIFNDGSVNPIFGNIAQNNGTNYGGSTGIPASITSMYTVATGMFSGGTMTILDNISG